MFKAYIIQIICHFILCVNDSSTETNTPYGKIRGYIKKSHKDQKYLAYEGIPYAEPPLNNLRFEPPKPLKPWSNVLEATKKNVGCLAYKYKPYFDKSNRISGSEDCLYLDIYIPMRKSRYNVELFPVIIWFYGGSFQFGSTNEVTEKYMMDRDIILVAVNYRLGPLGFLSTEDGIVPGNMGLKDQNMAMRWIKNNIIYFKGDPNSIILGGVSAGGASVQYHYLSPMSYELFHGGFSVSGTALANWAQAQNSLAKARQVASLVHCPFDDNRVMVQCLKNVSAKSITATIPTFWGWNYDPDCPFGPVVEKSGSDPFISVSPAQLIANGHIQDLPWITGVVSDEGLWSTAFYMLRNDKLKELNDHWDDILPYLLNYEHTISPQEQKAVARKIRKEYFGSLPVNEQTRDIIVRMQGDRNIDIGAVMSAQWQAKMNKKPVWFYQFAYKTTTSLTQVLTGTTLNLGVCHTDDVLQFLQYVPSINYTFSKMDREFQNKILDVWETFAYTKRPVLDESKWKPIDPSSSKLIYLMVYSPENYSLLTDDNFGNIQFWSTINFNENRVI